MEREYYDLEDKINLIYDYFYNLNTKNCFSFDKIALGKISLDDIKISLPEKHNDSEITSQELEFYQQNKNAILDGRFKLLEWDDKMNEIIFKKYSNQFSVNMKISFYTVNKLINSFDSKVNNDSLFSYLLSQLVLGKKTKHILLPIINLDCVYEDIERIIQDDSIIKTIKKKISDNEITSTCCLQLREHFFKTANLEEFLKENTCSYKGLLFQIIHTLAVIQNDYEGFRHNNLLVKNVLIYLKKSSDSYTEYDGFKNDKFYLPNFGSKNFIRLKG